MYTVTPARPQISYYSNGPYGHGTPAVGVLVPTDPPQSRVLLFESACSTTMMWLILRCPPPASKPAIFVNERFMAARHEDHEITNYVAQ